MRYILYSVAVLLAIFFAISGSIWQIRNPKANEMTYWTHFSDSVRLRKLEKFQ